VETKTLINNDIYDGLGERWYTAHDDPVALLRKESATKIPWVLAKIQSELKTETGSQPRLLDVGCGAGFLTNRLAKENFEVHGVDLSADSLRVARAYDSTKSVKYITADAYKLPYPDNTFDVVTSMDFLEHVENPEAVIKEISRVLKPRALFFFHTFNRNWLAYVIIIKLVEWFVKNTPKHMHILRLFIKPKELAQMCEDHGMATKEFVGVRPRFTTITIKSLFTGIVPENFGFTLTGSTLLSYLGFAVKK
jgi:2-polyprenyl-6-hydroxyphenyl methylase/3-demethylubiquinone-9 3-methyltransferase